MKAIVLEVLTELLEAWGFVSLDMFDAMVEQCWNRGVELSKAGEAADRLFIKLQIERHRSKLLREFAVEVKADTHPNVKRHGNIDAVLFAAASRVLSETRESEDGT